MDPGRDLAFFVLRRLEAGVTWRAAWQAASGAAARDPRAARFALEIAGGCTRLRARLDAVAARHAARRPEALDPALRVILRMGLYQLFEADGVAPHAAVHTSVELAKRHAPRAAGLANAVLRAAQRAGPPEPPAPGAGPAEIAAFVSHPEWIVQRWRARFGDTATSRLCAYGNSRPQICLRPRRGRATQAELLERLPGAVPGALSDIAVRIARGGFAAARACVAAGDASVQDESAMSVVPALGLVPGEDVLDVAAAPGGKTCHAAETMNDTGRVRAFDRTAARVDRIRANAARLGLRCVEAAVGDARRLDVEPADAVLVDAPCSGLGVLARRPDLRWRKTPADLPRLAALQGQLLSAAARHVRPGGRLVYSVCSFEPEETLGVVAAFAAAHARFVPDDEGLVLRSGPGFSYFLPHEHGTDGGFVARWRRL